MHLIETVRTSSFFPAGALRSLGLALAMAALVALAAPVAASADVHFGSALASQASAAGVGAQTPTLAGNDAGVVATAYAQKVGAVNHVFARVKAAGTAAFGAPQELSTVSSGQPASAVAADGTVTVAWQQANACAGSSVWVATAPPGGGVGPAVKVASNAFDPQPVVTPDGTVMVLYTVAGASCTPQVVHVQVRPRAGAPVDSVISDSGYGEADPNHTSIGVDASGTAIVAFTQHLSVSPFSTVLRVARRPAGGAWTATTLSGPTKSDSALAVARDGHAVVAYGTTANNNGNAIEARSLAPGASVWGGSESLTNTSSNEPLSGVAVADGGAAVVTTDFEDVAVRPAGASSFGNAVPVGLSAASDLIPVFSAKGELALVDLEKLPGSNRFSLVARMQAPGAPLGAAQATGLDSDSTGGIVAAAFGANDIATGWANRLPGSLTFTAGLALGDGTPPTVGAVSAPAAGVAGTPLGFGSTPSDDLGIADVAWTFGDGASASGAGVTHAFASAGASTWSLTARDLAGNTAGASGGLTIAPAPQAPSAKLAVRISKPRRGTRARKLRSLGGTASGPVSRVEISVVRVLKAKARSARARCRALSTSGRLVTKTSRAARTGCSAARFLKAKGTKRWTLSLRHRLPSGSYVVFARARSASGAKSAVVRTTFTLRR